MTGWYQVPYTCRVTHTMQTHSAINDRNDLGRANTCLLYVLTKEGHTCMQSSDHAGLLANRNMTLSLEQCQTTSVQHRLERRQTVVLFLAAQAWASMWQLSLFSVQQ